VTVALGAGSRMVVAIQLAISTNQPDAYRPAQRTLRRSMADDLPSLQSSALYLPPRDFGLDDLRQFFPFIIVNRSLQDVDQLCV
jgi:hypothetical protein